MKRIIVLLLVFFLLSSCIFAQNIRPGFIHSNQFVLVDTISELHIGFDTKVDEIAHILGMPEVSKENIYGWTLLFHEWEDLEFYTLMETQIPIVIRTNSERFKLKSGIGIGDSKSNVLYKLGTPGRERETALVYYFSDIDETWAMQINLTNEIIVEIEFSRVD